MALMSLALRKWTLEERRAPDEGKADREFGGVLHGDRDGSDLGQTVLRKEDEMNPWII